MSLKNQITEDMKSAMKAGDKDRLKTVRLVRASTRFDGAGVLFDDDR